MLTDGSLNSEDLKAATEIAERTQQQCTRTRYKDDGQQVGGGAAVAMLPDIKKIYRAEDSWYKAEVAVAGIWDNVYLNFFTKQIVCGQKNWEKFGEAGSLSFKQVGIGEKSVNETSLVFNKPDTMNSSSMHQVESTIEQKLIKLKSLFEKNLITSQQYEEQMRGILNGK